AGRRGRAAPAHRRGPRPAGRAARGQIRRGREDRVVRGRGRSEAPCERAGRVIPGGVNSPVRAFGAVGGTPRFFARGQGAYLEDVDGKRYVDLVWSWGPQVDARAHIPDVH